MENHYPADKMRTYACPMHPEITGKQDDQYQLQLTTSPQIIEAGHPVKLTFAITQNKENTNSAIAHAKKIHVMVVSEDLNWFQHIHPLQQEDGTYAVTETFHNGGKYFLYADLRSSGVDQVLQQLQMEVHGYYMTSNQETSNRISKTDGYTVTLENARNFKTGNLQSMEVSIEKDGIEVKDTDLQTYLGSSAHIVMIHKADKDFLHLTPKSNRYLPIYAETYIEKAGAYKIWVQFKINGKLHTANFIIDVVHGEKKSAKKNNMRSA